ncbi:NAD-dependent epimerase/dehydratase family protein [Leptospira sp. 2 VSF19]|uniref:NAD-dependent epimerase/dehydratase family protein n=1 Tax=Leptospira soteropolitanensis TaxID=2950025 RepID=A0AAW5V9U6_9LEPT|nr:NAD-dependent epimerase/dehydratase family protein [Leptospira soteropolitanensis]MCW7491650.1 NAD-dependent epimerase/dehydratase family protein [Leptospira soteropolitanensis]MCW7499234.1 NAD-dependent epimerase/dehydratase family protein [Leptospira soteropolitanensis]MCW7521174.1 NAD-dependent epimerase/dehydratase family protein [Leptospira soteropolitanensis]MCW7525338.1 NAD-dependent epimerase/dehydratase family protein [Leptospira soteropolitanensis]MCW7529205.1 NAD-dependent epimer
MKFTATTLITGANGFIGFELLKELSKDPKLKIRVTDLRNDRIQSLKNPNIEFFKSDIRKEEELRPLLDGVDRIFHVAGICNLSTPYETLKPINVNAVDKITDLALEKKVKAYIHFSSSSVYGIYKGNPFQETDLCFPLDSYGKSKYDGEQIVNNKIPKGLKAVILRPCTVYGPGCNDGAGKVFSRPGKIAGIPGNGKQRLANIRVEDVASAAIYLSENESLFGEVFNIADDSHPSLEDALSLAAEAFGSKINKIHIPLSFLKVLAKLEEPIAKLRGKIPDLEYEAIKYLYNDYYMDNRKLKSVGYTLKYPDFENSILSMK